MAKQLTKNKRELFTESYTHFMELINNKLSERELTLLAAGMLDVGLAELLEQRLADYPKVIESFLGFSNHDAPAATFAARIKLALLTGLITLEQYNALNALRDLRNLFAHKIKVELAHPDNSKPLGYLYEWLGTSLSPYKYDHENP